MASLTGILSEAIKNLAAMGGTADTANKVVGALNQALPGFAACGLAAFMGSPALPILVFTAATALGIAGQLKEAKDQAERDAVTDKFVRDIREPYNSAREVALKRWPDTPQFDDLSLDWLKVLEAVAQDEAGRVIDTLSRQNQEYWNWFADYIKPLLSEVLLVARGIDAPPLYVPKPDRETNLYRFADQRIPLLGRDKEQGWLRAFLDSTDECAWMLAVGGAGSGKSRLGLWAVEQALARGYDAGFLVGDRAFDGWGDWKVRQDTFVVVDYVLRRRGDLGLALQALFQRAQGHRVRVLLLERDTAGTWYDGLSGPGLRSTRFDPTEGQDAEVLLTDWAENPFGLRRWLESRSLESADAGAAKTWSTRWLAKSAEYTDPKVGVPEGWQRLRIQRSSEREFLWIDLRRMEPPGVRHVFTELLKLEPVPRHSAEALADAFLTIEPNGRPLFAAFYFEAVREGKDVTGWSATDLASHVVDKELADRWRPAGLEAKHGHLATVAAALKGVAKGTTDGIACLAPFLPPWELDPCSVLGSLGGGFEREEAYLPGLAPDSLAERYVLMRLEGKADLGQRVGQALETSGVLKCLWSEENWAGALTDFVLRCALSLPTFDRPLGALLDTVPPAQRQQVDALVAVAKVASGATLAEATGHEGATAKEAAKLIDRSQVLAFARALFAKTYGREDSDEGRDTLAQLRGLLEAHPSEPQIREMFAMALTNAILEIWDDGAREQLLAELRALAGAHPNERELRIELAKGLSNSALRLQDDPERLKNLHELMALHDAHRGDPELRLVLATALSNAAGRLQEDRDRGQKLDELHALAEAHPGEPQILLRLATGLTNALGRFEDGEQRNRRLAELRALAETKSDWPELRLRHAMGLTNIVGKLEEAEERARRLEELRALALAHPGELELRLCLAKGLLNVTVNRETTPVGRTALEELQALAEKHSGEPELRAVWSWGLTNVAGSLVGDRERRLRLEQLRALAETYPSEQELRISLAKGLTNSVAEFLSVAEKEERLEELRALAGAQPGELGVRQELAKGLVNLVFDLVDDPEIHRRLDELRALAWDHPGEALLRLFMAQGIKTAVGKLKDDRERGRWLDELRILAEAHPADAAVRQELANGRANMAVMAIQEGDKSSFLHWLWTAWWTMQPPGPVVVDVFRRGILYGVLSEAEAQAIRTEPPSGPA